MKKLRFFKRLVVLAALLSVSAAVTAGHRGDIVDVAVKAGQFETLAKALGAADLVGALKGKGPFTVFAPTDEAFAKLPKKTLANLLKPENKDQLRAILTYHVVSGKVKAAQAANLRNAATLNGQRLAIEARNGGLTIDDARVIAADVAADNGVIHIIDTVMLPAGDDIPTVAKKAGGFGVLLTAVKTAGLAETLMGDGPFTVFAPTDAAFEKLPKGTVESLLKPENRKKLQNILKYHVVSGRVYSDQVLAKGSLKTLLGQRIRAAIADGGARVNQSGLVTADIQAANGVIHVIDQVLLPEERSAAMPADRAAKQRAAAMDLIETAIEKGAPIYNHGNARACAAIYEVAAKALLAMDVLPRDARQPLSKAMRKIKYNYDPDDRAWTLRYGLDSAMEALGGHGYASRME